MDGDALRRHAPRGCPVMVPHDRPLVFAEFDPPILGVIASQIRPNLRHLPQAQECFARGHIAEPPLDLFLLVLAILIAILEPHHDRCGKATQGLDTGVVGRRDRAVLRHRAALDRGQCRLIRLC